MIFSSLTFHWSCITSFYLSRNRTRKIQKETKAKTYFFSYTISMNQEDLESLTPAMQQYYDIKKDYQDSILFFRMGDFYEMFESDAQIAHKILGITLTSRNKNAKNPILLAGIPYHAKEKYLPLLIKAGYKVAIAEQVSDPKLKGIVKREVTRVVTPATLSLENEGYENIEQSSVVIALVQNGSEYGFSSMNLSNHVFEC